MILIWNFGTAALIGSAARVLFANRLSATPRVTLGLS
jgi:hypothetical protein